MSWNYRVIRRTHERGPDTFGIHEVYYDNEDKPNACTVDPVSPYGETLEELKSDLDRMWKALEKPALDYSYFDDLEKK